MTAICVMTAAILVPDATPAATQATSWAAIDGSVQAAFQNHAMGHDDPLGANGT